MSGLTLGVPLVLCAFVLCRYLVRPKKLPLVYPYLGDTLHVPVRGCGPEPQPPRRGRWISEDSKGRELRRAPWLPMVRRGSRLPSAPLPRAPPRRRRRPPPPFLRTLLPLFPSAPRHPLLFSSVPAVSVAVLVSSPRLFLSSLRAWLCCLRLLPPPSVMTRRAPVVASSNSTFPFSFSLFPP